MRLVNLKKSVIVQNYCDVSRRELEKMALACAAVLKVMNSTPFTPTMEYFPDDEDYGECYRVSLVVQVNEEYLLH